MDFKSILENAQIQKEKKKKLEISFTDEIPPDIQLNSIDDLIQICKYFNLTIPTSQMFENESQISNLITFLKKLREDLIKYEIKIPIVDINEIDIKRSKEIESEIDKMEIDIAHMEKNYTMLNEFRNEVCRFHNKDVTITADLVSTSTTYDIKNNIISNVFLDNSEHFSQDRIMSTNFKEKIDANLLTNYMKALQNVLNELLNNPVLRHKERLNYLDINEILHHHSFENYRNMKNKQFLLNKMDQFENSFLKLFFIELIEKRTLFLEDIHTKYNVDRMQLFKIVYFLQSKKLLKLDRANECVKIFCD